MRGDDQVRVSLRTAGPSTSDAGSGQQGNGGIFEEPDRVRVRYNRQTRWNNVWLRVPGVGFTAIDAAVNVISDAAGWPQRF
jgi:hypothetical protein